MQQKTAKTGKEFGIVLEGKKITNFYAIRKKIFYLYLEHQKCK